MPSTVCRVAPVGKVAIAERAVWSTRARACTQDQRSGIAIEPRRLVRELAALVLA